MIVKKRTIVIGIVLIALLVGGIVYLTSSKTNIVADNDSWICDKGISGISVLTVTNNSDSESLSFELKEDAWEGPNHETYTRDMFAPYLSTLGYMKAIDSISSEERETYGLSNPTFTVSAVYSDGEAYSYDIGNENSGGLYIGYHGDNKIYLIDGNRKDAMLDIVKSIYDVRLSGVDLDDVRGAFLHLPGQDQININRSEAPRAGGDFYWNMYRPYSVYADNDKVKEIFDTIESIGSVRRIKENFKPSDVDIDPEDENQSRIELFDAYDNELIIYIGKAAKEGYYCSLNFIEGVYVIDNTIEGILSITPDSIIDKTLYYYESPSIEHAEIDFEGKHVEFDAEWETSQSGNARGQRFKKDGEPISGGEYNTIVSWFEETKKEEIISDAPTGEKVGSIRVERISAPYEETLTFYKSSDSSRLIVNWGGLDSAYVEYEAVKSFILSL